jgi:hypothetical protein
VWGVNRDSISVHIETYADVYPEDLEEHGYHHEDDCPAKTGKGCGHPDREALDDAFDDLHRQAGHGEFPMYVCLKEPCRSLYLIPAGIATQVAFRKSVA